MLWDPKNQQNQINEEEPIIQEDDYPFNEDDDYVE